MLARTNLRDRWLLTYADFITLLFATFVLMYAIARGKEQRAAIPVPPPATTTAATATPNNVKAAQPLANLLTDLETILKPEQDQHTVIISTEQRGIVISLDDQLCFDPGQAEVQAHAVAMFSKVAATLSRYPNRILLEGHTDSQPIHNGRFRSNWELSTARSIAVMELMEQRAALGPERFLIVGSADTTPVLSNETEQGRAHNRRVEIVVLNSSELWEPVSPAAAPSK